VTLAKGDCIVKLNKDGSLPKNELYVEHEVVDPVFYFTGEDGKSYCLVRLKVLK